MGSGGSAPDNDPLGPNLGAAPSRDEPPWDEATALAALAGADARGYLGDDAAILQVPGGRVCASTDTAIVGVHLHHAMTAEQQGYRACACALSDLAAMAAAPLAVLAAISVPDGWWDRVPAIAAGIRRRAAEQGCHLVGGDLVRSAAAGHDAPLSITITVLGAASGSARGAPVRRTGARAGDGLFVTGSLGRGAAGLLALDQGRPHAPVADGYLRPPDRLGAARALAPFARALMDLSDGLGADLPRMLAASGCGGTVDLDRLPVDPQTAEWLGREGPVPRWGPVSDPDTAQDSLLMAATAGDDYELLLAADPADEPAMRAALARIHEPVSLTKIGSCADTELTWTRNGQVVREVQGFHHR